MLPVRKNTHVKSETPTRLNPNKMFAENSIFERDLQFHVVGYRIFQTTPTESAIQIFVATCNKSGRFKCLLIFFFRFIRRTKILNDKNYTEKKRLYHLTRYPLGSEEIHTWRGKCGSTATHPGSCRPGRHTAHGTRRTRAPFPPSGSWPAAPAGRCFHRRSGLDTTPSDASGRTS